MHFSHSLRAVFSVTILRDMMPCIKSRITSFEDTMVGKRVANGGQSQMRGETRLRRVAYSLVTRDKRESASTMVAKGSKEVWCNIQVTVKLQRY